MSAITESVQARSSPYFGLDYYEEKYGAWFFGRETDAGTIVTNLRAARLTLLHAESGVGKSSLLRAAVAWRLRKLADDNLARRGAARSVPIVFSSWKDDPAAGLANAIHAAIGPYLAGRPAPGSARGHLDEIIAAAANAANASLLIMLDQFEEYFLYRCREPTPERFADELARCINRTDLRANFLVAIREDAYAGLGDLFKGRIPNIYSNYLHIEHLDRASAEQAIRRPLEVYNSQPGIAVPVMIQDELVAAVLDQVRAFDSAGGPRDLAATADGGGEHVAAPLLQLVMETIWEKERQEGSHQLRLSTLQKLHGVGRIADDHLGQALRALSRHERRTALDTFDHLVTPSGGKIAESIPDLAQRTGHSENELGTVLEKLDHERIVRSVPAAPGQDPTRFRRYEIFHDLLTPTINRAIAAGEEKRRVRRIRRLSVLAVTLLIVMSVVAVIFANVADKANFERLIAESRELAAEASLNTASDPELSTLLALQALGLRYTSQAEEALRAALPELQALRTFDGPAVSSAEFDPVDGNKVLSADLSGEAWISDVRTGQRLLRMSLGGMTVTGSASAADFNPPGTEVAIGYANGTVAIFDARTGKELTSASDGQAAINGVAFLGNTGVISIASQQNLALWQYQKGPTCCDILANAAAYTIGTDPADPHEFAVTTDNGPIIWNVSAPGPRSRPLASTVAVNDVEFSQDGSEVVTADNDGTVDIYNLATDNVVVSFSAVGPRALTAAFSPDGKHVVAGYLSGTVRVWDVSTRLPLTLLVGNAGPVNTAQFNAEGSEVLTAGEDGTVRVWAALPREMLMEFPTSSSGGTPHAVAGAGYIGHRILTLDEEGNVEVFTASGQRQAVISPGLPVQAVDWNRAGTKIVTASPDGTAELWQASGSGYTQVALPTSIDLHAATYGVAMSADGSLFAIAFRSSEFTVQVRSADTGLLLQTLNTHYLIEAVAVSPNGREIVGGDDYGHVEVWDNGALSPQLVGAPSAAIINVSFSQDGSKYVTVSTGGVVDVRDAVGSRLLTSIEACPSASTASFSPDGSKIVVACGDGTLRVFDAVTGEALVTMQATNAGIVSDAAFSPDGQSIVASFDAGTTGYVQVWSAELATSSLAQLEQLAEQRVTERLSAAQQAEYLAGQ